MFALRGVDASLGSTPRREVVRDANGARIPRGDAERYDGAGCDSPLVVATLSTRAPAAMAMSGRLAPSHGSPMAVARWPSVSVLDGGMDWKGD